MSELVLRWKKFRPWMLDRGEQVLWTAVGANIEYKITRKGTADKPAWTLYVRRGDGVEEGIVEGARLGDVKRWAAEMESGVRR